MRDFSSYLESQSIRYQTRIKQGAFVPIKPLESSAFKTTALYISLALVITSIAILPFSYSVVSIKLPVNLLFIAFGVFALGFWREYRGLGRALGGIWFALVCLLVVIIMAYISLFWAVDSRATLQAIRQYLLEPSLFLLLGFLLTTRLDDRGLRLLLIGLCLALSYHPIATIWDFFTSAQFRENGFAIMGYYRAMSRLFHTPDATLYAFWLALGFCITLAFVVYAKGLGRILAFIALVAIFFSSLANGSRFLVLTCCVCLLLPFILLSYKHKAKILLSVGLLVCVAGFGIYVFSDKLNPRFNVKNMIDNFRIVWSYYPAEMGRFSPDCYTYLDCSTYSKQEDENSKYIRYEESSLSRISAMKSGLTIASLNPFIPHGFGSLNELMKNLRTNFDEKLLPYRYMTINGERLPMLHIHHQWISFLCETSIIGLVAISLFFIYFLVQTQKALVCSADRTANIIILSLGCFVGGLMFMFNFDIMLWREENLATFILLGILLGVCYGKH